jgi:hypothetical protein
VTIAIGSGAQFVLTMNAAPLETTLTDQRMRLAKRVGQQTHSRCAIRETSNDRQAGRRRQNPQQLTSVLDGRLSVAISASGQAGA